MFAEDDYYNFLPEKIQERENKIDNLIEELNWETSDGDSISISDLTDHHLKNIIEWLENNEMYRGDDWIKIMKKEQLSRDKQIVDMFD